MQNTRCFYIETYGCQMNFADTEVVLSVMQDAGYSQNDDPEKADVILINTCVVRENAERRVLARLNDFKQRKKTNAEVVIGVLGCMAEHLRKDLMELEDHVDLIVGPDEYRKLPALIDNALMGEKGIAVQLSRVENYDDIIPLRTDLLSAWVSIMRGCDKFCTFCVVPFTRGRERSRTLSSLVQEIEVLSKRGFKEVTLLGQNVNSYRDGETDFADLLARIAEIDRKMRLRFMTSHPQDMSEKLISTIAVHNNICKHIHLPVQSGSDRILELMNRNYTADYYRNLIRRIRDTITGVSISTDIIAGFPTETKDDHTMTLDLMREVVCDGAFTFKYSPRKNTKAWQFTDDVPEGVKKHRLNEIIDLQRTISLKRNREMIGQTVEILIEGPSKKSGIDFCGRTDTNKIVIFSKNGNIPGDYVSVLIERVNAATLFGNLPTHTVRQADTPLT